MGCKRGKAKGQQPAPGQRVGYTPLVKGETQDKVVGWELQGTKYHLCFPITIFAKGNAFKISLTFFPSLLFWGLEVQIELRILLVLAK